MAGYSSASARFLDKFSTISFSWKAISHDKKRTKTASGSYSVSETQIRERRGESGDHICVNKGSHVKIWMAIEIEFIVYQLICGIGINAIRWEVELRNVFLATVAGRVWCCNMVFEMFGLLRETGVARLTGKAQKFIGVNVLRLLTSIAIRIPCEEPYFKL
jgi:hypothetical protein